MVDYLIAFLLNYSYVFIAVLFVIKIVLFMRHKNKTWTVAQFFYFNPMGIKYTSNNERAKVKRLQNGLSVAIVVMILVQLFFAFLF
ncbi:MAG TPA: hypothetical protein VF610_11245 [Segetibacter sp.]|jgi:hypothetical protein